MGDRERSFHVIKTPIPPVRMAPIKIKGKMKRLLMASERENHPKTTKHNPKRARKGVVFSAGFDDSIVDSLYLEMRFFFNLPSLSNASTIKRVVVFSFGMNRFFLF